MGSPAKMIRHPPQAYIVSFHVQVLQTRSRCVRCKMRDPWTDTWASLGPMPSRRAACPGNACAPSQVLVPSAGPSEVYAVFIWGAPPPILPNRNALSLFRQRRGSEFKHATSAGRLHLPALSSCCPS